MIHKKQTFAVLDGWLCLRRETTFSDEPKKSIHYWPIAPWRNFNGSYDAIVGAEAIERNAETYDWQRAPFDLESFRLIDGGKTQPIKFTTEAVPPPKTTLPVRWYYGEWQKYLKTKGWVCII